MQRQVSFELPNDIKSRNTRSGCVFNVQLYIHFSDFFNYIHVFQVVIKCPGDCPFESEPSPTTTDACGEVTGCASAAKRLCVAPEADLGESALHLPPQKSE